ncbi:MULTISPECIES: alpha/beta fold hydrolase [unclassified Bacillus (in: firmicutes)]|uniref:alpha/beta fold hydrolase n=1 Tax=unclassified Bacillus (in: firmicutes) TaxID=185979 RepID=UPI0008F1AD2F|nr:MULTISPECIES: alpha/beta hydrolase [unclassified Bacillus (in: firmicutes)]SFB13081.1 Pimeloyl-ACP methyl ester carboxylesterase [Bacillus sp. UNCCL13]SFQ90112.1 Pimeloyl-ACP methyl ester carboxylesterase [Bacillus sp. cl95]
MEQTIFSGNQTVNGIEVYYERYPNPSSNQTIVLLHGFLSSTFSFRRLIPLLNQTYQVISVDLPPFGKSGKSHHFIYSYKNIANTVVALMEELSIEHPILIGHSMGGQIVMNILKLRPDFAEKAILLCSSGYLKRSNLPLIFTSYIPYFHLYVKFWLARSGVRKNLQQVVHDQSLINDEMLYGYLQPFLEDEIFIALTKMIRHREGDLSVEDLRKIDTKCLLIWGEHDKVVPLSVGKRLNKDLPNSNLIVLDDTGHLVPEERPEEVYEMIKSFIESA